MTTKIHSTAIISSQAELDHDVEVGPYAVIEDNVVIGKGTKIASHAVISGYTEIGEGNQIGVGAVIGLEPQDISYKEGKSFTKIGNHNKIREYVQIHRGTKDGSSTVVGNNNFFLAFCHIAHNCQVGNNVILVNGALLGGYVVVEDFAFISGLAMVHQFCRVGAYAMMRGGAKLSLDLPPYCVTDEMNWVRGINVVGLERRGFSSEKIIGIKKMYKQIFSSSTPLKELIPSLLQENPPQEIRYFLDFIRKLFQRNCAS